MNQIQALRHQMANNHGVECTPEEVEGLYKIAEELKDLSCLTNKELKQIFDLKDSSQLAMFAAVQKIKNG